MWPSLKVCLWALMIALAESQYRQRPKYHYNVDDDYHPHPGPSPQTIKTPSPHTGYGRPSEQYSPAEPVYHNRPKPSYNPASSGEYTSDKPERGPPDFGPSDFGGQDFSFDEAPPRAPSYEHLGPPPPSEAAQTPVHQHRQGPPQTYDDHGSYERPDTYNEPPTQHRRPNQQSYQPSYDRGPTYSYDEAQRKPAYDEQRDPPRQQYQGPSQSFDDDFRYFPSAGPSPTHNQRYRDEEPYQQPGPAPVYEDYRGDKRDAQKNDNPAFDRFRDFLKDADYPGNDYHGSQSTTRGYSPSHGGPSKATPKAEEKVNYTTGFVVTAPEFPGNYYEDLDSRRVPGFRVEDFLNPYVHESSGTDGSKHVAPVPAPSKRYPSYPREKLLPSKDVDEYDGFRPSLAPPQRKSEGSEKKSHKCTKIEKKFDPDAFGNPDPYRPEIGKPVMTCYHCEAEDGRFYEKCSYGTGADPKPNNYFEAHEESYDTNPKKKNTDRSRRNDKDTDRSRRNSTNDKPEKTATSGGLLTQGSEYLAQLVADGDFGSRIRPRRQNQEETTTATATKDDIPTPSQVVKPESVTSNPVKRVKAVPLRFDFNVSPEVIEFEGTETTTFGGSYPRIPVRDYSVKNVYPDYKDFEESVHREVTRDRQERRPKQKPQSRRVPDEYPHYTDDFYDQPHYEDTEDYYRSLAPSRKEVEKVIDDIDKKDHKNCRKVKKGDMICYECDDKGDFNDECMYAKKGPKSHHLAYHTSTSYSSNPKKKEVSASSTSPTTKEQEKSGPKKGGKEDHTAAFDGDHDFDSYFEPDLFDNDDFHFYRL